MDKEEKILADAPSLESQDLIGPDYGRAKHEARAILDKYGIDEPIVPVFSIIEKEGLNIQSFRPSEKLREVAGFFDLASKTIYVNDDDPANRQTFTVAHELAHFVLGHKEDTLSVLWRHPSLQNKIKQPQEQEANCFAAELLVSTDMLKGEMKKRNLGEKDVDVLAKLFGVSKRVVIHQLKRR